MRGVFQKIAGKLEAAGPSGRDALAAVKDGALVVANITLPRSPEQLNKFWALCSVVAEADDVTKDSVKDDLLIKARYVTCVFDKRGKMEIKPRSIAMDNMEQDEFDRFFAMAVEMMAERLGTKRKEFMTRFNEILKGRKA